MKFSIQFILALAGVATAAYVPSDPWSTLTPSATFDGGITDYSSSFGIAIETLASSAPARKKRDVVSQIGDGQLQETTGTAALSTKAKSTTAAEVVSQIGDGQIQATTATKAKSTAAAIVSQIGDGQIQATTSTAAAVVSQISDGQIQATTSTSAVHTAVASQISDGQIQASTSTHTTAVASQISDGQAQASTASSASSAASATSSSPVNVVACESSGDLSMTLAGGVLTDARGRLGSIVANRQFQFDGPPPQAGAIYAAGWSITPAGNLAIGDNDEFYQCLSGTFYNLYDQSIGSQCHAVHLQVVELTAC